MKHWNWENKKAAMIKDAGSCVYKQFPSSASECFNIDM